MEEIHLMLDIETMGNKSNSVITQISAVEFDIKTGKTGREFNNFIDIQSCLDYGLNISGSTVDWWLRQPKDAQEIYTNSTKENIYDVLFELNNFIKSDKEYRVWGNSARFDCGILEDACIACGLNYPFKFWAELDLRTIVFLNPEIKYNSKFEGVQHNAIDDCKHQIKYLVDTLKSL